MRTIFGLAATGLMVYWGLTMEQTTMMMIFNNITWILITGALVVVILFLISQVVRLNSHNITNIYNVDNSTHTTTHHTTNTAYIGSDAANRLGANKNQLLTSGD